jgi:hypothetical protein
MKRLLPRVVPEAVGLLGLLVLASAGCAPENNVKPGAPVLLSLAILEPGGATTTVTPDTVSCAGGSDGGVLKTQDACSPSDDSICKLTNDSWCRCIADMDDMTKGAWNCDAFEPMSVVIATFDRLLDTNPLDPGDAATSKEGIASIDATPKPAVTLGTLTDYSSTGSTKGAVFNLFGPAFFGNQRSGGPSLQIMGTPALPTSSSVEITLDPDQVRAKDGKTPFTAEGLLANGSIKFKTKALTASLTIPMAPPPPPTDAGAEEDGGADGGVADGGSDAAASEGGPSDGGTSDGGTSDGGTSDGGTSDGGTSDGGVTDGGLPEVGTVVDASVDGLASDAPKVDAALPEVGGSDAAADVAAPATPAAGEPVPADMAMAPIVLEFNNIVVVDDVAMHIKVTENGQTFKVTITADPMAPNKVNIAPGDADSDAGPHEWAAGKTYEITVDGDVTDAAGDKLDMGGLSAKFVMAN